MKVYASKWLSLLLCLLLLGCQNEKESTADDNKSAQNKSVAIPAFNSIPTDQVFAYNCADSLEFTAHVTADSTWLFLPDTTLKVLRVEAGSGAKYEGSKYIYWSKGNEAILQKPKGSFMTCQSVPQERSWAAATIRGIDFRAQGQEPGWHLELEKEGQIKYVGDYGQDSLSAKTPNPTTNKTKNRTEYQVTSEGRSLKFSIVETPCTDSMNGMKFSHTVSIVVDGDSLNGCGRYLH
ncbi:MAG: MliC family protein [Bacteroidota bacterium]